MKELSPEAEGLRQAIQDGIELKGITADAIAQTIVEVLKVDEETIQDCTWTGREGFKIGLALSNLLELAEWEVPL